jgi:hypothetical protein
MAIFKIMLITALPFVVAPFVSPHSDVMTPGSAATGASTPAAACEHYRPQCHGESIIYKNQATPDFLRKQFEGTEDGVLYAPNYNATIVENRRYLEV